MTVNHEFYLSGKDHLTELEAAYYYCVSVTQLKNKRHDYGIEAMLFLGEKIYRRAT